MKASERHWLQRAADWWNGRRKSSPMPSGDRGWTIWNAPWLSARQEPTALQLLEAYADTAYYCANINARAVANSPLRLFVRTRPGEAPTKHPSAVVSRKALAAIRRQLPAGLTSDADVDEV